MNQNEISTEANQLIDKVATGYGGSYTILELIGRGGMSDVYKARVESTQNENPTDPLRATSTGKVVACKILLARLLDSKQHSKRFHHEATLAKRLMHPNIVNVYDAGEIDSRPFMILEHVNGATLSDVCKAEGKLPIQRALPIFLQISGAFAYAHLNNIIHRDLKPSNIMLTKKNDRDDFVKVVDFGIAKIISETTMGSTQLTKTGDVFGTPIYMSPEQCRGDALDVRSDIYSLGILMYETLTGHPPFEGPDSWSILLKQNSELPKGLGDIDPDILLVKKVERIIFKCLEKEPSARYQTMDDLMRDLETAQLQLNLPKSGKIKQVLLIINDLVLQMPTFLTRLIRKKPNQKLIASIFAVICIVVAMEYFLFRMGPEKTDRNLPIRACIFSPSSMHYVLNHFWDSIKINDMSSNETSAESEELLDDLLSKAEVARLSGSFNQAVDKYNDAFVFSTKHSLDLCNSSAGAEIQAHLAYCYLLGSDSVQAAQQAALSSLKIYNHCGLQNNPRALLTYAVLAESSRLLGNDVDARAYFDKFFHISFEHSIEQVSPLELALGDTYAANFYKQKHNIQSADTLFRRAIAYWQNLAEPAIFNLGSTFNSRALLELANNDLSAAKQDLDNARTTLIRAKADNRDLAVVYFTLADVLFAQRNFAGWLSTRKEPQSYGH